MAVHSINQSINQSTDDCEHDTCTTLKEHSSHLLSNHSLGWWISQSTINHTSIQWVAPSKEQRPSNPLYQGAVDIWLSPFPLISDCSPHHTLLLFCFLTVVCVAQFRLTIYMKLVTLFTPLEAVPLSYQDTWISQELDKKPKLSTFSSVSVLTQRINYWFDNTYPVSHCSSNRLPCFH